jgi:hypothetical protein
MQVSSKCIFINHYKHLLLIKNIYKNMSTLNLG